MSHFKERTEKNCLNCNTIVEGRYCHVCGQENVETRETFWHLLTHFVYDVTHFDGKFFNSTRFLLFKPGFLSLEYMRGRRMKYLNPIKMYVFISAFFFLYFFSVFHVEDAIKVNNQKVKTSAATRKKIQSSVLEMNKIIKDSTIPEFSREVMERQLLRLDSDLVRLQTDTTNLDNLNYYNGANTSFLNNVYSRVEEYDSVQNTLAPNKQDSWVERRFRRQGIMIKQKYGNDQQSVVNAYITRFFHFFPQMLFVSLPIFAMILFILYVRRRINYFYADHIIYTVHLYCATFIFLFLLILLGKLSKFAYLGWLQVISWLIGLYILYYGYKAMRVFYAQSRKKTVLKYLLLLMMSTFMMSVIFFVYLIFSAFMF